MDIDESWPRDPRSTNVSGVPNGGMPGCMAWGICAIIIIIIIIISCHWHCIYVNTKIHKQCSFNVDTLVHHGVDRPGLGPLVHGPDSVDALVGAHTVAKTAG